MFIGNRVAAIALTDIVIIIIAQPSEIFANNGNLSNAKLANIDKIIAKNSRKRLLSFELTSVVRLEKYNPMARPVGNFKKTVIACNEDDPNAYFMVTSEEGKGMMLLVFSPDERIKSAIVKFVPKHIGNSAFKN